MGRRVRDGLGWGGMGWGGVGLRYSKGGGEWDWVGLSVLKLTKYFGNIRCNFLMDCAAQHGVQGSGERSAARSVRRSARSTLEIYQVVLDID